MNKKYRGTPINALPVKTIPSGSDVILAEDSENKFSKVKIPVSALGGEGIVYNRVDVAETSFSASSIYPIEILNYSRMKGKYGYILNDYINYASFLFWEFMTDDGFLVSDLRFNNITEINTYINNNVISESSGTIDKPFKIKCYIKQLTGDNYDSLNKIVNYNGLISKLKGRNELQNRRIVTLQNVANNGFEHPFVDDFSELIYNEFLGISGDVSNRKNTIGIPSNYSKIYNLIPTKYSKGKVYDYTASYLYNPTGKRFYDSVDDDYYLFENILPTINNKLYYLNSIVIGEQNPITSSFISYGENPKMGDYWFNYSCVRVYHLVDNLLNPRYHYFMVKPIGVDQFIIPFVPEYITGGTAWQLGVIFTQKHNRLKIYKLDVNYEASLEYNSNKIFRIRKIHIPFNTSNMLLDLAGANDKLEFRFFLYEPTTGLCSPFTEQFNILFKSAGASLKIMPNRNIRNGK